MMCSRHACCHGACASSCGRDCIAAGSVAWTHHRNQSQLVAAFKGTSALWSGHVFFLGPGCEVQCEHTYFAALPGTSAAVCGCIRARGCSAWFQQGQCQVCRVCTDPAYLYRIIGLRQWHYSVLPPNLGQEEWPRVPARTMTVCVASARVASRPIQGCAVTNSAVKGLQITNPVKRRVKHAAGMPGAAHGCQVHSLI